MTLSADTIEAEAAAYRREEPLYPVEAEQIEGLPGAIETGTYGWRDVEWIVRWFYRRHLGTVPNADRRAREGKFDANDFETVRTILDEVVGTPDDRVRLETLQTLSGVSVPLGTGFLMFIDPNSYLTFGPREWTGLERGTEVRSEYPSDPTVEDVLDYFERCRRIGHRADVSLWTLYRALWRLGDPERDGGADHTRY